MSTRKRKPSSADFISRASVSTPQFSLSSHRGVVPNPAGGDGDGANSKKCYRSSDARWRSNLKSSFRVLQTVATTDRNPKNVCGKNVRKTLLDQAFATIIDLEHTLKMRGLDLNAFRFAFDDLDTTNTSDDGISEVEVVPEEDGDIDMDKSEEDPHDLCESFFHLMQQKAPDQLSSSFSLKEPDTAPETTTAEGSQRTEQSLNMSFSSVGSDPLKTHMMSGFDLDTYLLTSTPRTQVMKSSEFVMSEVKRPKFAPAKTSTKARRKLDLNSVADDDDDQPMISGFDTDIVDLNNASLVLDVAGISDISV